MVGGAPANASSLPSFNLSEPAPELADFIQGSFTVGGILSVDVADLPDWGGLFSESFADFRWLRDGQAIPGATADSYTVTQADVGAEITAVIEYRDNNFNNRSVTDDEGEIVIAGISVIDGTAFSDTLPGTAFDDQINSYGGDDVIAAGAGDDSLDGGEGIDTAVYSGNQASYTLQFSASGTIITDRRPSQDGTDTLVSIEDLQFTDGTFDIGIHSGAVGLSAEDFAAIAELYIAYFDRAPASGGLLYWATRLDDGMTLPEVANSFFVQSETQRTYEAYLNEDGSLNDTEAFVTAVFNNVLGRDPNGPYWVNELDNNPGITPAIFILAVLNGAKAETGGAADRAYLSDKVDIGVYFSAIKGLSDRDDTVTVMEIFDGSNASVDAAVAAIDQIHADALDPVNGEFLMQVVGVLDNPFAIA
jgi:hypothetical protein